MMTAQDVFRSFFRTKNTQEEEAESEEICETGVGKREYL
jgi:hypothetical protein